MVEGLANAMHDTKEQAGDKKEAMLPDFIKKELQEKEKDGDAGPSAETTGPLASSDADDKGEPGAETDGTVAFKGGMKDEYNYNYYMNEARKHKESAESNENWARQRFDWANSYADSDPGKAKTYIDEGRNWQSKAQSEWSAYRADVDKANSYK